MTKNPITPEAKEARQQIVKILGYPKATTNNLVKIDQLLTLLQKSCDEAETKMGEAIIERMEQSNFQWEKAHSFINTYQLQKEENMHNLKALKERGK